MNYSLIFKALFLISLLILISGCTELPPEIIASKIQAKYDSMSAFEMETTEIEVVGNCPSYAMEEGSLPIISLGHIKLQKPDKYFIEYKSGDKEACLGNVRTRYFTKGDRGIKQIFKDNSLCKENVNRRFKVYDIVIAHIKDAKISEETLGDVPVIKASINLKINTGELEQTGTMTKNGEEVPVMKSKEEDLILTYWFDVDSYLALQYEEEIPALGYSKIAKFNVIGIESIELPSSEGIEEVIPSSDGFEIITEQEDIQKIDVDE